MTVIAVVVAAGSGSRAGRRSTPKQYQTIAGRPVIWWTLKAFCEHPEDRSRCAR